MQLHKLLTLLIVLVATSLCCQVYLVVTKLATSSNDRDYVNTREYVDSFESYRAQKLLTWRHVLRNDDSRKWTGDRESYSNVRVHRLKVIELALKRLLRSSDKDIRELPVAMRLDCEGEEEKDKDEDVPVSFDQVCISPQDLLDEIQDLGIAFEKTSLLDLKITLVKLLLGAIHGQLADPNLQVRRVRTKVTPQAETLGRAKTMVLFEKLAQLESRVEMIGHVDLLEIDKENIFLDSDDVQRIEEWSVEQLVHSDDEDSARMDRNGVRDTYREQEREHKQEQEQEWEQEQVQEEELEREQEWEPERVQEKELEREQEREQELPVDHAGNEESWNEDQKDTVQVDQNGIQDTHREREQEQEQELQVDHAGIEEGGNVLKASDLKTNVAVVKMKEGEGVRVKAAGEVVKMEEGEGVRVKAAGEVVKMEEAEVKADGEVVKMEEGEDVRVKENAMAELLSDQSLSNRDDQNDYELDNSPASLRNNEKDKVQDVPEDGLAGALFRPSRPDPNKGLKDRIIQSQPLNYDSVRASRREAWNIARENPFSPPSQPKGVLAGRGNIKRNSAQVREKSFVAAQNELLGWKGQPRLSKAAEKQQERLMGHRLKRPLSQSMYKLIGFQSLHFRGLEERGFSTHYSFNSSRLNTRKKEVLESVVDGVKRQKRYLTETSLSPNLLDRGKHQRLNTDMFCGHNKIPKGLPPRTSQIENLFKHLLYDDKRKIVVCYVPKNGCSNLKRLMLVLNGLLPPEANRDRAKRPSEDVLGSVHSFRSLTREEAIYKLENYLKFAIVRNPMERLLSGYRNKLESPLNVTHRKIFPDRLKAYILNLYDRKSLERWIAAKNYSQPIFPDFGQFIQFMTEFSLSSYNEHFMPFLQLCFPCAINYDVVLNFKSLNYDIFGLMEYLGIPESYYPTAVAHGNDPTSSHLSEYFGPLSSRLKTTLFNKLHHELSYYYAIYPEEGGMHTNLI